MKHSLSNEQLCFTLKKFTQLMNDRCEYFPCFGTLLGLVREGNPIQGDDDVDFYVNKNHFTKIKDILTDLNILVNYNEWPNQTENFIQAHGVIDTFEIRADFYFYDNDIDQNFIHEKWNFDGKPEDAAKVLKLPKPLIFPLKQIKWQEVPIYFPRHSEIICEILYGSNWKIPQKKNVDYITQVHGGRPFRLIKNETGVKLLP